VIIYAVTYTRILHWAEVSKKKNSICFQMAFWKSHVIMQIATLFTIVAPQPLMAHGH
jgi:hypothetical protein